MIGPIESKRVTGKFENDKSQPRKLMCAINSFTFVPFYLPFGKQMPIICL